MNCKNCGAPLTNYTRCDYCLTILPPEQKPEPCGLMGEDGYITCSSWIPGMIKFNG